MLRRRIAGEVALSSRDDGGQLRLSFAQVEPDRELWEYQVLVTNLTLEASAFGQLYRDRGDDENIFDEMKNQWGWGGFTTHDLARCRLAAQMNALFFDWWNIFVRLGEPDWHREAITSRPLLMSAVATRARQARRTTIRVTSAHAEARNAAKALAMVADFMRDLKKTAEQLTGAERWRHPQARLQSLPRPDARTSTPALRRRLMQPEVDKSGALTVGDGQLPYLGS